MAQVTLIDGAQVEDTSEAWRAECEARYVFNLPSDYAREGYLERVASRRGAAAAKELRSLAWWIREADHVCRLPTKAQRNAHVDGFEAQYGSAAAERLRALAIQAWKVRHAA